MVVDEEKHIVRHNEDLGWLFGLPPCILYVYYGGLIFLNYGWFQEMDNCGRPVINNMTVSEVVKLIKSDGGLMERIERLSNGVSRDYYDAKEMLSKHKKLLSKYGIKELEAVVEGHNFVIRLWFEDYESETLFRLYFRTSGKYMDGGVLLRFLDRIIDKGEDGVKEYYKWLEFVRLLKKFEVEVGWFNYFRLDGEDIVFKGKDWNFDWCTEFEKKMLSLCEKGSGNSYRMRYGSIEEFSVLLELLG